MFSRSIEKVVASGCGGGGWGGEDRVVGVIGVLTVGCFIRNLGWG